MRARFVLALVAVAVIAVPAAAAKNPPHPSGLDQPLKDGCQRSDFGVGLNTSPEWVYVYRNRAIRMASGVVRVSHGAVDDAILQHNGFDFNGNLVPDKPFRYLIAGSPATQTNNFASVPGSNSDEEFGRLHFEWEGTTLPFFAWPTDGDRATIWGSWIWDCGHWSTTENNAEGSKTTGEHSELHPLNAIAVTRHAAFAAKGNESQTDVFISNEGTPAHAVEECALQHKPKDSGNYDDGFRPCAENPKNDVQPLQRSYSFFVPAPKRPSKQAKLRFRVVKQLKSAGREKVKTTSRGLDVTVTMPSSKKTTRYAKSFFVSWSNDKAAPAKLKFALQSILINHADPNQANQGSDPDKTPPPWNLYLNVNGSWRLLNDWAPALVGVHDGQSIAVNRSFTFTVPKGEGVWVQASGRECDEPGDTTVFGIFAHVLKPCSANRDEINPNPLLLLMNDDPGTVLDIYKSPAAALGSHVSKAAARQNWPGTGMITFGHGAEGDDDYELSYTISKG